jgi:hypothetical protein
MRLIGRGEPSDVTFEVDTDLSTSQWTFVKPVDGEAGGPQARLTQCGAGDSGWILQNSPGGGRDVAYNVPHLGGRIRRSGFSKLKVDGSETAIAVGDKLKPNEDGLGVKATSGQYSAIAYEASDAEGDIIEVLVEHGSVPA